MNILNLSSSIDFPHLSRTENRIRKLALNLIRPEMANVLGNSLQSSSIAAIKKRRGSKATIRENQILLSSKNSTNESFNLMEIVDKINKALSNAGVKEKMRPTFFTTIFKTTKFSSGYQKMIGNLCGDGYVGVFTENIKEALALGFSLTNISNMFIGIRVDVNEAITELLANKEILLRIVQDKVFTIGNISSILSSSGIEIGDAIRELETNKKALYEMVDNRANGNNGFKASNISNILNGAGVKIGESIKALVDNKEALYDLIRKKILSPSNISSMLGRNRSNVARAISELVGNKDILYEMIEDSVFTASNISSILNGAGSNLAYAIKILVENKNSLYQVVGCSTFTASNISSILNGAGANIEKLIKLLIGNVLSVKNGIA